MLFEELVMNLIDSINNYDLDNTKKYVDLINELPQSECAHLTEMLDIHKFSNYALDNYCFDYVLLRLHYLIEQDNIRWKRDTNKLLTEKNVEKIEQFIYNQLKEKTYNINNKNFIHTLIQLTVNLQNREKTAKIFTIIRDQIKEDK